MFGFNELCTELQNTYETIIDLIINTSSEIWNNSEEECLYKTSYAKLGITKI